MKTLINFFISFSLVTVISTLSPAANAAQDFGKANKIRIIEVDASHHQNEYDSAMAGDPWHGFNYAMFQFNDALDQFLLSPIARAYRFVMPKWGRERVSNVFNNLEEPANFINSILQGDVEGTFRSFWRFVINTGFGVGGIGDVAAGFGLHEKEKGLSQTLAVYGIGSGPYLVLPILGPSTPRDAVGSAGDIAADPTTYVESPGSYIFAGVDAVQTREGLLDLTDDMRKNSFDLYSSYKSSYLQHRKKKVLDSME